MLAPQFSLRAVLIATAVFGVISLIGGAAVRGSAWAAALVMALAALVLMIAVHGMIFFATWVFSQLFRGRRHAAAVGSPFAGGPPPLAGSGIVANRVSVVGNRVNEEPPPGSRSA